MFLRFLTGKLRTCDFLLMNAEHLLQSRTTHYVGSHTQLPALFAGRPDEGEGRQADIVPDCHTRVPPRVLVWANHRPWGMPQLLPARRVVWTTTVDVFNQPERLIPCIKPAS